MVGVSAALVALGIAGLRGADPVTVYPAMRLVAAAALAPLVLTALATGVLQAVWTGYGLVRLGWVRTKLALTAVFTVAALGVAVPGLGRAAEAATSGQEVTPAQQLVSTVTPSVAVLLVLFAAGLGVFKPGR